MIPNRAIVRQAQVYSDFDFFFTPHPISKDVARVVNEEAVKQSIKNIVLTDKYEVPFNPLFGCNVRKTLFENFSAVTSALVKKTIEEAIINFEPRCQLIDVVVSDFPDDHRLLITIIFTVINNSNPITLQLFLDRVR